MLGRTRPLLRSLGARLMLGLVVIGFAPIGVSGRTSGNPAEASRAEPPRSLPSGVLNGTVASNTDGPVTLAADRSEAAPRAVASVEGTASPGLRITLRGSQSEGRNLTFQWFQTWGPEVELDDPSQADPSLIVPRGAGTLVFVVLVRNQHGVDTATIRVPIRWSGDEPVPPDLIADAGDNQRVPVGRQVTLNGIRSMPRGEIGYRWIQVDGPPVSLAIEDGYVYTFVPKQPGLYRFALVVALNGSISKPDYVSVEVVSDRVGPLASATAAGPDSGAARPIEEIAASGLLSVEGGPDTANALADAFESVANRMDLYASYADAYREISMRLDGLLPAEPMRNPAWSDRVFEPLSHALIAALCARGLDLSRPEERVRVLGPAHREEIATQFRRIAAGFRSVDSGVQGSGDASAPRPEIEVQPTGRHEQEDRP